jgi:hypothetical protein
MRTKTLLLTAALGLAGAATTMAQVYSVNAVGYVNVTMKGGFNMVANPLDAGAGNNTVSKLFPANSPAGLTVYKFGATGFDINTYDPDLGGWTDPNATLTPGEGAFVLVPGTGTFTVTFVGEVMQGHLVTDLPQGFSIRSSKVPQSGPLAGTLGFPIAAGDTIYRYDASSGYSIYAFDPDLGGWAPEEPSPAVGEAFWVAALNAKQWVRDFNVNQ